MQIIKKRERRNPYFKKEKKIARNNKSEPSVRQRKEIQKSNGTRISNSSSKRKSKNIKLTFCPLKNE